MNKTLKNKINKFMKKMEGYANRMLKDAGVTVKIVTAKHQSFTYFKDSTHAVIQIGIEDAVNPHKRMDAEENSWANIAMRLEGVVNHEIAHLLYSQFERVKYCKEQENAAAKTIKKYALGNRELLLKENDSYVAGRDYNLDYFKDNAPDKAAFEKLRQYFYDRVYWHNMRDMLNIVEDAAIEGIIPSKKGASQRLKDRIYATVAANRNNMFEKDKRAIENISDPLVGCISEFHEFGVIGYRTNTPTYNLRNNFTRKEVDGLFDLAMYSKWNTKNTEERYIAARTVMDKFSNLIREKSDRHMAAYLTALAFENDADALNDMSGLPSEISISVPNATAAGSSSQKSEYDYDASDETKKDIEKQKEKTEQEDNNSGNDGQGDSDEENGSQGEKQQGTGKDGKEQNSENKGEDGNSNENSNKSSNGEGNDSQNSQQNPGNGQNEEQSGSSEGETGEESSSTTEEQEGGYGTSNYNNQSNSDDSYGEGDLKDSDNSSKDYSKPLTKSDLGQFQEHARETMEELKKSIEKIEEDNSDNALKESIKEQAGNIKKQMTNSLPDCDIDFHAGIKTKLYTNFQGNSKDKRALDEQPQDKKMVVKVASEMNLLKMYDRRAKTVISKKGKLNNSTLYRAMTDQKCFKKTTPGKKKNFRVALLMDLSGSMCGRKIVNTIRTAYVLASACIRCRVPVAVWGHSFDGKCNLYKFVDYNQKTPKDLDTIYTARAGGCNQDGLAIYHTLHDLVAHKHGDEELVLIVISDGMPAGANSYYGIPAENDIKSIKETFKKLFGVHTIGVTIETSQDEIDSCRRIYGENTVVVEDSNDLPLETIKVLKKIIC